MLDFSQVVSIGIPEGNVVSIYDGAGLLIWTIQPVETVTVTYGDNIPISVRYHENFIGNFHTVTFLDRDLNIIKTQNVEHGKDATPPTPPVVPGYTFIGWAGEYTHVTENRTITAIYAESVLTSITDTMVSRVLHQPSLVEGGSENV